MLEGLEISEVKYGELNNEKRIDSEYYLKSDVKLLAELLKAPHIQIGSIAKVTDGIHSSIDYSEDSGINLISATSPRENVFDLSRGSQITKAAHLQNPRTALKLNDVILSSVGTIGNCAVVRQNILPANSDRHVGIIRIINDYSPYVLSTFLLSKYGKMQTLREATGNVQLNLFLYKIKELVIPDLPRNKQKPIEAAVIQANELIEHSKFLYHSAETYLLEQLGLTDFAANPANQNIKSLRESFYATGRLDAEYYLPKYEDYERLVKSYSGGYGRVKDYFVQNVDSYTPNGKFCRYIEIGDVDISNGEINYKDVPIDDIPTNAKIKTKSGDLLISTVRPNRGAVAIITRDDDNIVASGAFTIVREKATGIIKKEVLQTLLRTPVYKDWLLQTNTGCSYPTIRDEEVMNLTIPLIRTEVQDEIAEHVQKSIALRKEAAQLLETAKMTVEQAVQFMGGGITH